MDINGRRMWMDNRLFPGRRGIRPEFEEGLKEFVALAKTTEMFLRLGAIKCPCLKCKCQDTRDIVTVQLHLLKKGFMPDYYIWRYHGEPWDLQSHLQMLDTIHGATSSPVVEADRNDYRMEDMVHTGGSISAATQKMRLEKKKKRTIPVLEMAKIRHTKKDKTGRKVWVEPRAQEAYERASKRATEASSQQSDAGSCTPAPLTAEQETQIWLEVNGGVNKGNAYGLGSLFTSDKLNANILGASSSYAPSGSGSVDPEEINRMKEQIALLTQQITQQNEESRREREETNALLKKILAKKKKKKKKSKEKHRRRHRSPTPPESVEESGSGSSTE